MDARFPWRTHLIAPLAVAAFFYLLWAGDGGFAPGGWAWGDLVSLARFLGLGLLVVGVPATILEVGLLVLVSPRLPAQVVVVVAAWFAFQVSHFVAAFNLSYEPVPVPIGSLAQGLLLYGVYALAQTLIARWLVGVLPTVARKPHDERPLLVRLGLVEDDRNPPLAGQDPPLAGPRSATRGAKIRHSRGQNPPLAGP